MQWPQEKWEQDQWRRDASGVGCGSVIAFLALIAACCAGPFLLLLMCSGGSSLSRASSGPYVEDVIHRQGAAPLPDRRPSASGDLACEPATVHGTAGSGTGPGVRRPTDMGPIQSCSVVLFRVR